MQEFSPFFGLKKIDLNDTLLREATKKKVPIDLKKGKSALAFQHSGYIVKHKSTCSTFFKSPSTANPNFITKSALIP